MISLPSGFDLTLFISEIVTYIGVPIVTISFSFCVFKIINYALNVGSKN